MVQLVTGRRVRKLKPEGQVESTGQLAFVDGEWQYDGSMRLNLHRFDLVEAFTSQFAAPRGDMSGELQFRGRGVAAPQWSGSLAATDFAAELPELGLELSAGALAIVAVPTGIIVRGAITSGGGQLVLDGGRGDRVGRALAFRTQWRERRFVGYAGIAPVAESGVEVAATRRRMATEWTRRDSAGTHRRRCIGAR